MLSLFTIIHPLVDACSVSVLVAGGMTWERVIAYNALAFALQLPLGVVMDEWPRFTRLGFFVGTGLFFVAAVSCAFGMGGWLVLVAACVGNALFHLTAGKHVLEAHGGRAGPIGLFISTGALGLMAGQVWAAQAAGVCLLVFAGALGACVGVGAATGKMPVVPVGVLSSTGKMPVVPVAGKMPATPIMSKMPATPIMGREVVLVGLFVLIAWRSWAGLFAGGRSAGGCALMMLVGAAVTFAGKVAGGYLAERIGYWKVTVFSVVGSAALVFFCEPEWIVPWLVLLFIAQLATGPVLSLVYGKMDRRGGTSFGLNCLGLFMGSLA